MERAIHWLACQEHQRFFLLQQNEASNWADVMPRSGFVLYSNALWHLVKRLYALPKADETRRSANQLLHPFSAALTAEYRRARLLAHYARRRARNRDLFVYKLVNFAVYGDEGDVYGNVLTILCGLADEATAHRVLRALERARVNDPYPVRAVCDPITPESPLWRPYMSRHRQNLTWQYHNGGVWPFVGGFWVAALARAATDQARRDLVRLAQANALRGWQFNEWLHGRALAPAAMHGQSWNAAGVPHRLRCAGAKPAVPDRAQSTISRFSTDLTPSTDRAT